MCGYHEIGLKVKGNEPPVVGSPLLVATAAAPLIPGKPAGASLPERLSGARASRKTNPEGPAGGKERRRVAAGWLHGGSQMSGHQREIYHSENGDRWLLCRDNDGRVFVLHKANLSSGGTATEIELGDFLGKGKAGLEPQALARIIGPPADRD